MSIPIGYLPQEVKPHPLLLQLLVAQAKSAEESNVVRIQKKKRCRLEMLLTMAGDAPKKLMRDTI